MWKSKIHQLRCSSKTSPLQKKSPQINSISISLKRDSWALVKKVTLTIEDIKKFKPPLQIPVEIGCQTMQCKAWESVHEIQNATYESAVPIHHFACLVKLAIQVLQLPLAARFQPKN